MVLTEHKMYYADGKRQLLRHYFTNESGEKCGASFQFYKNGNVAWKIRRNNEGLLHGERIYYCPNGGKIFHQVWINGQFHAYDGQLSEIDRFELSLKWGIEWF